MSNISNYEERVENLERQVSNLNDKVEEVLQWLQNLEDKVTPAVEAQRIRDAWHGI